MSSVGAVTGLIFGFAAGIVTSMKIKETYQKQNPGQPDTDVSPLFYSFVYW